MRIDGAGATPWLPNPAGARPAGAPPPASSPAVTATSAANQAQQSVTVQALQQAEQHKGGGGGGGGGHGHAKSLKAIEDLAARATLRIEPRAKTVVERMAEIERMKALQKAAAEKVGEKRDRDPDADEGEQHKHEPPPHGPDEEQPADLD